MTPRRLAPVGPVCFVLILALVRAAAAEPAPASRIVSVGGATTEIVYRLGGGDRIVAVDTTSRFPEAATTKPSIGYMRALSAEPILALMPSLVLVDENAGPKAVLVQLREAGTRIVTVPADPALETVFRKIAVISDALGRKQEGAMLSAEIRRQLEHVKQTVSGAGSRPKVLFLLSIGNGGAPMSGGANTAADRIIQLAGGANAIAGFDGYKPVSPEAIVEAAPDVILVTDRTLRLLGGTEKLLARPAVTATPAGRAGRIVSMDGLLLLGFGPRIGEAIVTLARHLHPDGSIGLPPVEASPNGAGR